MKKSFKKNFSGFTLIELLVTVTIIGILSSIAITGLSSTRQKAQDTSYLSNLRDLQLALEAYKSVNGKYPAIGTSPSVYISNTSGSGGFNIPLTSKSYGIGTGSLNIPANGTIYLRCTDCKQLGDGYLAIEYR